MHTNISEALQHNAVACGLNHLGLIEFSGEDAQTFLQGQLTNDTNGITDTQSQIAGYCTAKGRLLATLLLWKTPEGYCAQLHAGISAAIQKRLSMFVLRARVKVTDAASRYARMAIAGNGAESVLKAVFGCLPQQPMETLQNDGLTIIRMHGRIPRFEVIGLPEAVTDLHAKISPALTEVKAEVWEWLEIQSGVAQVGPDTQEEFVPQMLNLDVLDGISFKKGCYTGQEIVARTHYLGKVKRRTYLAHVDTEHPISSGEKVFGSDSAEPVGMVINTAAALQGGFDLLAEVRQESVEAGEIRVGTPEGPVMQLLEMPYGF